MNYDLVGNQKSLGSVGITYDAESRQTSTTLNSATAQYAYDGDGRRVKKVSGGVTTVYVYDAQGRLAAEYTTAASTQPPCATCYLTADPLGSTRLVSDGHAAVTKRYDYRPFGQDIPVGIGDRSTSLGYGVADPTTIRFTGKERDTETVSSATEGLDYFGARYLSGAEGRFTSPDPSNLSVDSWVPQTWNRYAYVGNNPLKYIDENGLWWKSTHDKIYTEAFPGLSAADLKSIKDASAQADVSVNGMDSQDQGMSFVHHMANADDTDPLHAVTVAAGAESNFIQQNQAAARQAEAEWIASGHTGISPNALTAFGNAVHPVADSTSPSHEDYQSWGGCGVRLLCASPSSVWHTARELPIFYSGQRRALTLQLVRQMFLDTFGWELYMMATKKADPEPDRQPPHKRCLQRRDGTCVE